MKRINAEAFANCLIIQPNTVSRSQLLNSATRFSANGHSLQTKPPISEMHIYKVMTLFAGYTVAAPNVAMLAGADSTPLPASASDAPSASYGMPTFTAAQANQIITDMTALDKAVQSADSAINKFTGGPDIQDQGNAIEQAGEDWQTTIKQMLSDVKALAGTGKFSDADSNRISTTVTTDIAPHLVSLYQTVQDQKPMFVQVGKQGHIYDTLLCFMSELQSICDYLQPLVVPSDLLALEAASQKITAASKAVISAYIV